MNKIKTFTLDEIKGKMAKYCACQDRCHREVALKLNEFHAIPQIRDEVFLFLIENGYLNEERFAKNYASGKFNQKQWGRSKIIFELKKKNINDRLIKTALQGIDENDYADTLNILAERKFKSLASEKSMLVRKQKVRNYLLQKGYENELVYEIINRFP